MFQKFIDYTNSFNILTKPWNSRFYRTYTPHNQFDFYSCLAGFIEFIHHLFIYQAINFNNHIPFVAFSYIRYFFVNMIYKMLSCSKGRRYYMLKNLLFLVFIKKLKNFYYIRGNIFIRSK